MEEKKEPNTLAYLEGMIRRFKGLTKKEMIDKYNRLAPDWGGIEKDLAQQAMKKLLSGEIPNEKIVPKSIEETFKDFADTPVKEVEEEITEDEKFEKEIAESAVKEKNLMAPDALDNKIPSPPPAKVPKPRKKPGKK